MSGCETCIYKGNKDLCPETRGGYCTDHPKKGRHPAGKAIDPTGAGMSCETLEMYERPATEEEFPFKKQ